MGVGSGSRAFWILSHMLLIKYIGRLSSVARISQWGGIGGGLGADLPAAGGWGQSLQPPQAREFGDFCDFSNKNVAFLCIFWPK